MNTEIRMPLPEFFLLRQKQTNIKKKNVGRGQKDGYIQSTVFRSSGFIFVVNMRWFPHKEYYFQDMAVLLWVHLKSSKSLYLAE